MALVTCPFDCAGLHKVCVAGFSGSCSIFIVNSRINELLWRSCQIPAYRSLHDPEQVLIRRSCGDPGLEEDLADAMLLGGYGIKILKDPARCP